MGQFTRARLTLAAAAVAVLLGVGAPPLHAQATGTVRGTVTEAGSQRALAGAQVTVPGTGRRTVTGSGGEYLLAGVPAGSQTVRVELIGYSPGERRVTVAPGGTATADLELGQSAVALDALVVTGTAGETRQRSLGTTVARVDAAEIAEKAPVSTVTQMLNGRAAGVTIINTTGMLGGGNRVRIRGAKSFSLSNEPLVYIDGVRVNNDQSTGPVNQAFGSRSLSRWNDINPEDIESIEILKGPAAATLYGTEASNGVIQIITKRGRSGQPRITATVKQGANWFANQEGRLWENYFDVGRDGTIESIDIVELEKSRGNQIWQTGHLQDYDLSISGGADLIRYYVAGSFENSTGADPENSLRHWGGRANVTIAPSEKWDVNASLGYKTGRTNIALEAGGGGLTWTTFFARPDRLVGDDPRRGFYSGTPEAYIGAFDSWQDLARTTISFTANHRPFSWFTHRLTLGQDLTREQDNEIQYHDRQWVRFFSFSDRGYKEMREHNVDYSTVDYTGTVSLPVREGLVSSSSLGGQMYRREDHVLYAYGENFPVPGLTSIAATTQGRTNNESSVENVTIGVFAQQQFAWQDRLFLTAALRADDNSAFGEEFDLVTYPKLSAAWVVTEEPFWRVNFLNTLKLRAAYGQSGQQPEAFAAIRTFRAVTGPGDVGTVTPQNLGNPKLGPERGKEFEVGFDAGLLNDRLSVEFSYYDQRTTDAILEREIAPSSGFSGRQFVNAGEIRNSGIELLVRGEPWRTDRHGLETSFHFATNNNEVVSLGDITDEDFISAGTYLRHQIGHPVGSWFSRRVVSATLDQKGIARNLMCDNGQGGAVACADAPQIYLGRTVPRLEGGFSSTLRLFNNIEIFGQLDFKTGFSKLDGNLRVRCYFFSECRENWFPQEFDPARIAEIQAAGPYGGTLIDDADFLKFREVSVAYQVPSAWAQRVGAGTAAVRVAGRNLYTWTKFDGLEPESVFNGGSRGGNHSLWEQNVLPQLQQVVVSLNVSF
ncbi:MAG TPA: SusC/RagA family TonB-linked outer membrane protein [Longimicrobiaceae bacterium]|nr:SusC/RagA family TonB-linked outer membrane protein [Longimicrobiaceae bacterium]